MNTITEDITNGTNTRFSSQRGSSSTGPAVQSNYTLLSVEVDDSGSYTCSMSGTGLKETISLRVTSATVSCKLIINYKEVLTILLNNVTKHQLDFS